ncbi:MAG: nuclear transport factor 2 family protein [Woeseiaceae bacterium]|jgi:hypothetical protein
MTEFEELTKRLYTLISSPSDARDWEAERSLYHPRATMVRTGLDDNGAPFALVMSYDEYIANATRLLDGVEFREVELRQEVTEFGNVAQLTSVYEFTFQGRHRQDSGRGVNFFNLINEGDGWKIMSIVWDNERDGVSLADTGLLGS